MASLKEIRGRIASIKGTLKITSAMRLISSAKLHSAQSAIGNMVPYEYYVQDIMLSLMNSAKAASVLQPYVSGNSSAKTVVVLVTSNQTLCGAFNVNIVKAFDSRGYDPRTTLVYAVGKYGLKHAQKMGFETVNCCDLAAHASYDRAVELSDAFVKAYLAGEIGKVEMVYAHFASAVSQPVQKETYLPFTPQFSDIAGQKKEEADFIVEPSEEELLSMMIPMVLRLKLHTVMLDSTAAEHAARTLAMQMASENAEELIGELSLQYNKLRQQAITSEILDLLGGQANN